MPFVVCKRRLFAKLLLPKSSSDLKSKRPCSWFNRVWGIIVCDELFRNWKFNVFVWNSLIDVKFVWNSSVDVDFVLILFEPFRLVRNFSFHVLVVGIFRRKNNSGVGCFVFWTAFFHVCSIHVLGAFFSLPDCGIFRPPAILRVDRLPFFRLPVGRPICKRKFWDMRRNCNRKISEMCTENASAESITKSADEKYRRQTKNLPTKKYRRQIKHPNPHMSDYERFHQLKQKSQKIPIYAKCCTQK